MTALRWVISSVALIVVVVVAWAGWSLFRALSGISDDWRAVQGMHERIALPASSSLNQRYTSGSGVTALLCLDGPGTCPYDTRVYVVPRSDHAEVKTAFLAAGVPADCLTAQPAVVECDVQLPSEDGVVDVSVKLTQIEEHDLVRITISAL